MSSVLRKMKREKKGSIQELTSAIKEIMDAKVVGEVWSGSEDGKVAMLVFEKYYLQSKSYAGLTMMLMETGDMQTADIVGSIGGCGLFNSTLGTNSEFADFASDKLKKLGFQNE